jgi:cold shock protein
MEGVAMMGSLQGFEAAGRPGFDGVQAMGAAAELGALADGMTTDAAVKWFNATKGYGFVELSAGRGDAFLHLKVLRETGRQSLPSGAKVRVVIRSGSRGAEVTRIVEIDANSAIEKSSRRPMADASAAFELTGKVKWFDSARGFGFVASDDFGRDVFVHSSTLGASGVDGLYDGQSVSMRVVETSKGREAIAIAI